MQQRIRRRQHGQALPEYALTIALVAVVVIVAAAAIGLAVQRVYGIVAGSMGAKRDAVGVIEIQNAGCYAQINGPGGVPWTGLVITGVTTEGAPNLTASTDKGVLTRTGGSTDFQVSGNAFTYNPQVSLGTADLGLCPQAVVIQAQDGAIAVSPLSSAMVP